MFGRKGDHPEYDPSEDGPEAKLSRDEADTKARRHAADMEIIDGFLSTLKQEDAYLNLLTWAMIHKWQLRRKKPR